MRFLLFTASEGNWLTLLLPWEFMWEFARAAIPRVGAPSSGVGEWFGFQARRINFRAEARVIERWCVFSRFVGCVFRVLGGCFRVLGGVFALCGLFISWRDFFLVLF